MNENLSKTFDLLRFPLALFVVYLHIMPTVSTWQYDLLTKSGNSSPYLVANMIITKITTCAVPTFFCISGYLLAFNIQKLNLKVYLNKIKNRTKTLFIPYLIWNILSAGYLYLTHQVSDFNLYFIFIRPANFPLWFLRNLIVMVLFFPFFYWLAKSGKSKLFYLITLIYLLLPFLASWHSALGTWHSMLNFYYVPISFFFFYLGIFLGIKKFHLDNISFSVKLGIVLFTILLLISELIVRGYFNIYTNNLYLLLGVSSVFIITHWCASHLNWTAIALLASSSFFIYCSHKIGPTFVSKYFLNLVNIKNDLVIYIVAPIITAIICVALFFLLDKYCKPILKLLTGR